MYIFMKKLSLFSFLGLAGLLAFVATPIYAQDNEIVLDDEDVVAEVDYTLVDTEATVVEDVVIDEVPVDGDLEEFDDAYVEEDLPELEIVDEDMGEVREFFESTEPLSMDSGSVALITTILSSLWMSGLIICLVCLILRIIAGWRIFARAWEGGWKILIPIYNLYIMYKIAGMKKWFWYSILVSFVLWIIAGCFWKWSNVAEILNYVAGLFTCIVAIITTFKLPRKFGWGVFASILYVLFTSICVLVLGFGNYKYEGKSEETIVEA